MSLFKIYSVIFTYNFLCINVYFKDIKAKFIKYELCDNYVLENLMLYEYKKPKYHISTQEFYDHCNNSINIF